MDVFDCVCGDSVFCFVLFCFFRALVSSNKVVQWYKTITWSVPQTPGLRPLFSSADPLFQAPFQLQRYFYFMKNHKFSIFSNFCQFWHESKNLFLRPQFRAKTKQKQKKNSSGDPTLENLSIYLPKFLSTTFPGAQMSPVRVGAKGDGSLRGRGSKNLAHKSVSKTYCSSNTRNHYFGMFYVVSPGCKIKKQMFCQKKKDQGTESLLRLTHNLITYQTCLLNDHNNF